MRPVSSGVAGDVWQFLLTFLRETLESGWDRSRNIGQFESAVSPDYDLTKNRRWA